MYDSAKHTEHTLKKGLASYITADIAGDDALVQRLTQKAIKK